MASPAVVGRGDDGAVVAVLDEPPDRTRVELRAVREDDERVLDLAFECLEPAAERRAWPVRPTIAVHHPCLCGVHTKWVSAGDDDDVQDHRLRQHVEDGGEELRLLRAAVPRSRPRGEHDGSDGHSVETVAFWISTTSVGSSVAGSPSAPILVTVSSPSFTSPMIAY